MPPRWNYSTRKQKLERKRTRDQAIRKQISQRTSDKTRNKPQQKEKTQIKEKVKAILEKRIVNLSLRTLTESETNLLRKGLNFCPTPPPPSREQLNKDNDAFGRRLSLKEYHAPDEIDDLSYERPAYKSSTLEKLNKREQQINFKPSREPYINTYIETLKQDVNEILSTRQKDQRSNLTKRERAALYRLSKDKEIVIKPADKGGATVIMNSADYIEEAMRQLNNQEYYKLVDRDLTVEHEQHIIESISEHVKNKEIDEDIGALLKPANSRTPLFYMLPKIHKANNPGRPVVSSVNSHTEKISAYVDEYLRPLAENLPSHVRDTTDFILRLKRLGKLPKDCYLVTLDVSSLYTNIDTDEGLKIVEEELNKAGQTYPSAKTLTNLLEKVLKLNNFTFNNEHFLQLKGTAMGTRAAPNFANVFMGFFENKYVYETEWAKYVIDWLRFIDDIFLVWIGDMETLLAFLEQLNNANLLIKFTHEISRHRGELSRHNC